MEGLRHGSDDADGFDAVETPVVVGDPVDELAFDDAFGLESGDVKKDAVIVAAQLLHLANRDEMPPRIRNRTD